ncbi:KilA-N domain-containing protein [Acidovorax sp. HDW3]|nr:KilA-N domain-containing protein [Acidovorax sp. HDW3]
MQAFTIGETTVRQHTGLFSLNDLHQASGGEEKSAPSKFLRLDTTQALIEAIQATDSAACIETRRGAGGGTYACRELVIAYAAWISAAFHLKVIRVFLAVATPQPQPPQQAPAMAHARGPAMMLVTEAERRHLEVLRFTIYAGREAVYELARDVQKYHPWVDGMAAMPHNTARHVPGLGRLQGGW